MVNRGNDICIRHTCTYHDNRDVNKTITEEYLRKYK